MTSFRFAALAALALLASACAAQPVHQARDLTPQGSDYDKALHANYLQLAQDEWKEGDYRDSDSFARRAIAAGSATPAEPQSIEERKLPADKVNELADARQTLMAALANGARERTPQQAARAVAMFDCWMQEQEEDVQPDDIAACRDGFQTAMAEVTAVAGNDFTDELASTGAAQVYGINFDFDSARLRDDARPALNNILGALQTHGGMNLRIEGHTDWTGTEPYNQGLSERRAQSVVNWLVENGIEPTRLQASGKGESDPVAENTTRSGRAQNRRVELETWAN